MRGLGKSIIDPNARPFLSRWVRAAFAEYGPFAPVATTDFASEWKRLPPDAIAAPYPAGRNPGHTVAARKLWSDAAITLGTEIRVLGFNVRAPAPLNPFLEVSSVAGTKRRAVAGRCLEVASTDHVKAAQGLISYRALCDGCKLDRAETFHFPTDDECVRKAIGLKA